jgi:hypothetical protein
MRWHNSAPPKFMFLKASHKSKLRPNVPKYPSTIVTDQVPVQMQMEINKLQDDTIKDYFTDDRNT